MRQITAYKTDDGKVYELQEEAIRHERLVNAEELYENNRLLGNYAGSWVDWQDLVAWVRTHSGTMIVRAILGD